MIEFLREGGYMMWLVVAAFAFVVVTTINAVRGLRSGPGGAGGNADAVLFWGVFALLVGVLGTVVGVSQAARVIEGAQSISSRVIWGGIRVALTTTIAGCVTFGVALCAWAVLRWRGSRQVRAA